MVALFGKRIGRRQLAADSFLRRCRRGSLLGKGWAHENGEEKKKSCIDKLTAAGPG
jgi:hypothetical protein